MGHGLCGKNGIGRMHTLESLILNRLGDGLMILVESTMETNAYNLVSLVRSCCWCWADTQPNSTLLRKCPYLCIFVSLHPFSFFLLCSSLRSTPVRYAVINILNAIHIRQSSRSGGDDDCDDLPHLFSVKGYLHL